MSVSKVITFDDIDRVNKSLNETDIKGKPYVEVNQRIKAFRMLFPNGTIQTEIISIENGVCIIKASVFDEQNRLLGTGIAYEKEGSNFINKTSYIENCETSSVGRALGMCGIGIDTSVASAEEVQNAIANQGNSKKPTKTKEDNKEDITDINTSPDQKVGKNHIASFRATLKEVKRTEEQALSHLNITKLEDMTMCQYMSMMKAMGQ